jgi:hypothetical protein
MQTYRSVVVDADEGVHLEVSKQDLNQHESARLGLSDHQRGLPTSNRVQLQLRRRSGNPGRTCCSAAFRHSPWRNPGRQSTASQRSFCPFLDTESA